MTTGTKGPTKKPKKCAHEPWLDTAIDLSKVLSLSEEGVLLVCGKPVSNSELVQMKSEAAAMEKFPLWEKLVETMRQYAVSTGFNRSEDFESVKVAKAMLLILDSQKAWTKRIAEAKISRETVVQK